MASYYNELYVNGKPAKAVLVRLHNAVGGLVDTSVTNTHGQYSFAGVPTGTYEIRFYGNKLRPSDWLYNIQIIDDADLEPQTELELAKEYLTQYSWGDSMFVTKLSNDAAVSTAVYPDATTIVLSDGFTWEGATGGVGTAIITITDEVNTELIPYSTLTLKTPLAYTGNRTDATVSSSGSFTGAHSHSYITRISQAGVPGVAKCDMLHEDGTVITEDNIIYQSTPIAINSGVSFTFDDGLPLYINDSWVTRTIVPKINKLSVFVDYDYSSIIDEARVIMNGSGDQTANLNAQTNTVTIPFADFGTTLKYSEDWGTGLAGKDFHIQLRVTRTSQTESIRIRGIYAVIGDSEEYDYWDVGDV